MSCIQFCTHCGVRVEHSGFLIEKPNHTINLSSDPFCPEGLTVTSHIKGEEAFVWDEKKVTLYLYKKQKSGSIKGTDLQEELKDQKVFNANLLDYLLEHPELIPETWKGKGVYFWGTIYRNADGRACVRYLYWDGGRWHWGAIWLGYGWDAHYPAAVRAT